MYKSETLWVLLKLSFASYVVFGYCSKFGLHIA